jgi:hypothetical protein
MSARSDSRGRGPGPDDGRAEHLYLLVREACTKADDLPARLEAALRVVLGGLAADPDLARRLTVEFPPRGADPRGREPGRDWVGRFGVLLGEAAATDPRASREPAFLAPFLLGGVRLHIARLVLAGEASDLLRLLPGLLEGLLAFYFEPGEPRALARAALAHE